MASSSEKKTLPIWSKLLIGFVAAGFVVIPSLLAVFFLALETVVHNAVNPIKIAKTAQKIGAFPQPLPNGNHYNLGASIGPFSCLLIAQDPAKQELVIFCNSDAQYIDAKSNLRNAYDFGINAPDTIAKFDSTISKGEEIVAGQKMPYIIGQLVNQSGMKLASDQFTGMVGCISAKNSHKNIVIYAWQPSGAAYDFPLTMSLLKVIKSF